MRYDITHQERYSRIQLLLRSLLGMVYLIIPHLLALLLLAVLLLPLAFFAWWAILITGRTPGWYYQYLMGLSRWWQRFLSRALHLADGYPKFGFAAADDAVELEVEQVYIGRGPLLLRSVLGWLYMIPHILFLYFRTIGSCLLIIGAWWSVLLTARYPASWHRFNTATLRWYSRLFLWAGGLLRGFPPLHGRPDREGSASAEVPL